jgi:hypothetical protein
MKENPYESPASVDDTEIDAGKQIDIAWDWFTIAVAVVLSALAIPGTLFLMAAF